MLHLLRETFAVWPVLILNWGSIHELSLTQRCVRGVFPSQEMLTESTEPSSFKALACMHFLRYLVDSSPHAFYCLAASGLGGGT